MKQPILFLLLLIPRAAAFDYEGHRVINELALSALSTNFPSFVGAPAARERILYLSGEPDRWRNTRELHLSHAFNPDHYFDVEDLAPLELTIESLSPFRYEFVAHIVRIRDKHPERFEPIDLSRDRERLRHLPGFAPWSIAENFSKLRSGFSTLRTLREMGTAEEVSNAEQSVVYTMALLSHFVADIAQPLHTTRHYNGWTGPNTNNFTTNRNFHAWIDGDFLQKVGAPVAGELESRLRPARRLWLEAAPTTAQIFSQSAKYSFAQHKLVMPLYELEKAGKLKPDAPRDGEGREFICHQFVTGAQMLADLWQTAFETAPPDTFLQAYLSRRKLKETRTDQ